MFYFILLLAELNFDSKGLPFFHKDTKLRMPRGYLSNFGEVS